MATDIVRSDVAVVQRGDVHDPTKLTQGTMLTVAPSGSTPAPVAPPRPRADAKKKALAAAVGKPTLPQLVTAEVLAECAAYRPMETHGPLTTLEDLASKIGCRPREIIDFLPPTFWQRIFCASVVGNDADMAANFLLQLPKYYADAELFELLQECVPAFDGEGSAAPRLIMIMSAALKSELSDAYQAIERGGAQRILASLFRIAGANVAFDRTIIDTYISLVEANPDLLAIHSPCFALILAQIEKLPADVAATLHARIMLILHPSVVCSDPLLCGAVFHLKRLGLRVDPPVLLAAALGPAFFEVDGGNYDAVWSLWKTALADSNPKHRCISDRDLTTIGRPGFIDVAEVIARAIRLADALGFSVEVSDDGKLNRVTVAFVAAMMSPHKGNFCTLAAQLSERHVPIQPHPSVCSFVHTVADLALLPTAKAQRLARDPSQRRANDPLLANQMRRKCALALAEGRQGMEVVPERGNSGYNIHAIAAASSRFNRHWHHIANAVESAPRPGRFHPILAAADGRTVVHEWTDPATGITVAEIDSDGMRREEADKLGHCGGATPTERMGSHCAQYAIRRGDISLATFDVKLIHNPTRALTQPGEKTRGAGVACWTPIGPHALRVLDIGGPGDTKIVPAEVTATWEHFSVFLQAHATVPVNRLDPDRPPSLVNVDGDFVTDTCGFDYRDGDKRRDVFRQICQDGALVGAKELVTLRAMFAKAHGPEEWMVSVSRPDPPSAS